MGCTNLMHPSIMDSLIIFFFKTWIYIETHYIYRSNVRRYLIILIEIEYLTLDRHASSN
ncbi:hypothetical protein ZOSMA_17G00080 [Zostera marina]|uniref:Uncharacterized protein n=1 Tax=Zostera marina TaxID=29655 RepID=A0A0K9PQV2_ZOSMR|nr:hypothetical protein ZOSMA_17G00080 [Zostera marina]